MATYVLGVGDRHSDNIMVKETGQVGLLARLSQSQSQCWQIVLWTNQRPRSGEAGNEKRGKIKVGFVVIQREKMRLGGRIDEVISEKKRIMSLLEYSWKLLSLTSKPLYLSFAMIIRRHRYNVQSRSHNSLTVLRI